MTVRGGGDPIHCMAYHAVTENGSFAADAHDCIMVWVLGPAEYKVVARLFRALQAGSPLIVVTRPH
jgi:hypothetical protein